MIFEKEPLTLRSGDKNLHLALAKLLFKASFSVREQD